MSRNQKQLPQPYLQHCGIIVVSFCVWAYTIVQIQGKTYTKRERRQEQRKTTIHFVQDQTVSRNQKKGTPRTDYGIAVVG